jgi:GT2 family glycosyltransferase
MALAAERLQEAARPGGLIASTDADTRVDMRWAATLLTAAAEGAQAIGGQIVLDPSEAARLGPRVIARREADLAARLAQLASTTPPGSRLDHPHFAGASFAVTPEALEAAGGLAPLAVGEDAALAERLHARGIAIERRDDVRVVTSARVVGRAPGGLAVDLAAHRRRAAAAEPLTLVAGAVEATEIRAPARDPEVAA